MTTEVADKQATQTEQSAATQTSNGTGADDFSAEDAILKELDGAATQADEGTGAEEQGTEAQAKTPINEVEEAARAAEIDAKAEEKAEAKVKEDREATRKREQEDLWRNEQAGIDRAFDRYAPEVREMLTEQGLGREQVDSTLQRFEWLKGIAHNAALARIFDGLVEAFKPDISDEAYEKLSSREWRYPRPKSNDQGEFMSSLVEAVRDKAQTGRHTEAQLEARGKAEVRSFVKGLRTDPAKLAAFMSAIRAQPEGLGSGATVHTDDRAKLLDPYTSVDELKRIRDRQRQTG